MSKVLVRYSDNYADEFDVEGFTIISKEDFQKSMELARKNFEEDGSITFVFGTNESIEYEDFEEFKNAFHCKEISENDFITLQKYFDTTYGYGIFPWEFFEEE